MSARSAACTGWSTGSTFVRNVTTFRYQGRNGVQCMISVRRSGLNFW
jgi:hypothetical protein